MNTQRWVGAMAALVLAPMLDAGATEAQVDQAELARQLAEGAPGQRYGAARQILEMGPGNADPPLRDALIGAFSEEAEAYRASRGGQEPTPDLDALGRMAMVASEFEDPRTIEPMLKSIAAAMGSVRGLAAYGDPVVPPVVEIVREGRSPAEINSALITLRLLAEGVGRTPLSSSSREQLIDVARERMQPEQSVSTILWRAIDLAIALDDPDLRETVEAMAADPAEVQSRLANPEPDRVERVQQRASARLRGEPPEPTWETLSSRLR